MAIKKVYDAVYRMRYEALFMLIFSFQFLQDFLYTKLEWGGKHFVNLFCATELAISYHFGLDRRALLGTILEIMFSNVNYRTIEITAFLFTFILILSFSLILANLIKTSKNQTSALTFCLLFACAPLVRLFFSYAHFGRLDLFNVLLCLLSAAIIVKGRFISLIPLLSIISMLIHQGAIFLFAPVSVMLLLYRYDRTVGKEKTKYLLIFIFNLIAVIVSFYVMQFIIPRKPALINDMTAYVSSKLGEADISYFISFHEGRLINHILALKTIALRKFLGTVAVLIQLSPVIWIIWHFIHDFKNKFSDWVIITGCLIAGIPIVVLEGDVSRFVIDIFISEFITIFSMLKMKNKDISASICKLTDTLDAHLYWKYVIFISLTLIGNLGWTYGHFYVNYGLYKLLG